MELFKNLRSAQIVFFGGLLVFLATDYAFADGSQGWRPVYDLVMEWINFLILAFVVYKFGRRPLMNFLRGQKDEIVKDFENVESRKEESLAKVREAADAVEQSKVRLPELKARLIAQGEHHKQELIDEAREQSRLIMQGALRKIDHQILAAREKLSLELLDMAMDEALANISGFMTPEDDRRQLEKYLAALG